MGVSLGFGVIFATVITLILVPSMYLILEDIRNFFLGPKTSYSPAWPSGPGQEGRYTAREAPVFFPDNSLCAWPAIRLAAKPNILFIMVDDLGKDWISCYGADDIETPHIDRLAKGGLKFHNAWSMPQCTPTRATLLTGQYPWRTGWVNHWDVPRWGVGYFDWAKYTSFAKVMKTAGYATAIAGKWQINDFRMSPTR